MSEASRGEYKALFNEAVQNGARKAKAAWYLGISLRTLERWVTRSGDGRKGPKSKPANALSCEERAQVLAVANSKEFANLPPGQIVPKLADQGEYIASESSFYRILKANKLLVHRSRSEPCRHLRPMELLATGPNQIWSWDITYLRTRIRGQFYYLYLPMDIFSRKIVHWEIRDLESADVASQMIDEACRLNGIKRNQLALHADNGSPMKGATMLVTLERLGVAKSFSRPGVSDDNPFSEALFKTLKYCPGYPLDGCFMSLEEAREWMKNFVHWYNFVHLHSGINWVTPAARHDGLDFEILRNRDQIYQQARVKNPERWSSSTRDWSRPEAVELNPERRPSKKTKESVEQIAS